MDLPTKALLYLLLITAGQGLALAVVTGMQKPRHVSFLFLSLFFLLMSLGCVEKSIEGIFYPVRGEELPLPLSMPLAYFPAIYLHLKFLMYPESTFRPWQLVHFLPSFVMDFSSFYLLPWSGNPTGLALTSNMTYTLVFERFYDVYFLGHFLAYTVAIVRFKNGDAIRPEDALKRQWLERMIPVLVVFWASWAVVNFIGKANAFGYLTSFFIHAAVMVSIYWFGYSFLLKMKRPFGAQLSRSRSLGRAAALAIVETIKASGVYKNRKVTLSEVSERVGYSQKAISNAINAAHRSNFNEFINYLRVEAFKQLATDPNNRRLSLFGIAQEAGFSSKASFHRAFKRECGQTPGEYLGAQAK